MNMIPILTILALASALAFLLVRGIDRNGVGTDHDSPTLP